MNRFRFLLAVKRLDDKICARCRRSFKKGAKIAFVEWETDIPEGWREGNTVHFYKGGEYYHQKCIGYGGYWRGEV